MSLTLNSTDEELREKFFGLRTKRDVAGLLEVEYRILTYYLYVTPLESRYKTFTLRKKSGGDRNISAPTS